MSEMKLETQVRRMEAGKPLDRICALWFGFEPRRETHDGTIWSHPDYGEHDLPCFSLDWTWAGPLLDEMQVQRGVRIDRVQRMGRGCDSVINIWHDFDQINVVGKLDSARHRQSVRRPLGTWRDAAGGCVIDYQATALLVASIFAWGVYAGCGAWVGMNYISTDSDPDFADWLAPILFAAPIFASAIIAFAALKYASAEERHARKLADKRRELELLQEQRKIDEQINAELDKMLEVDRE